MATTTGSSWNVIYLLGNTPGVFSRAHTVRKDQKTTVILGIVKTSKETLLKQEESREKSGNFMLHATEFFKDYKTTLHIV